MVLLDKLLPKLKERDSRVLIFSQVIISSFIDFLYKVWIVPYNTNTMTRIRFASL